MKKFLVPFLILTFMICVVDQVDAQRRGKKKRRTERKETITDREEELYDGLTLRDKLNTEIKLGNLSFFGNQLSISMKSNVGYKFNKRFSAGIGGKIYYDYINIRNSSDDISNTSFGVLGYARAKLTDQLYVQGEYNALNLNYLVALNPILQVRETILYPTIGGGYVYQGFNWSSGIEILVPFNDLIRDTAGIIEYWISFTKNF